VRGVVRHSSRFEVQAAKMTMAAASVATVASAAAAAAASAHQCISGSSSSGILHRWRARTSELSRSIVVTPLHEVSGN